MERVSKYGSTRPHACDRRVRVIAKSPAHRGFDRVHTVHRLACMAKVIGAWRAFSRSSASLQFQRSLVAKLRLAPTYPVRLIGGLPEGIRLIPRLLQVAKRRGYRFVRRPRLIVVQRPVAVQGLRARVRYARIFNMTKRGSGHWAERKRWAPSRIGIGWELEALVGLRRSMLTSCKNQTQLVWYWLATPENTVATHKESGGAHSWRGGATRRLLALHWQKMTYSREC